MGIAILIPIYKACPNILEEISIRQTLKVFRNYEIYFICPHTLATEFYTQLSVSEISETQFSRFDDQFFSSITSYNELLLKAEFYQAFSSFEYLLIVQPDAFVFRDELDYWIQLNYDYIGAPWFEGLSYPTSNKLIGVGNGGFSLRKTQSFINLLESEDFHSHPVYNFVELYQQYISLRVNSKINLSCKFYLLSIFKSIIRASGYNNNLEFYRLVLNLNEDLFISTMIPHVFASFKIPSPEIAKFFSFELQPSILYTLCDAKLPFGCHGWFKYEPKFWEPFIEGAGYKLPQQTG